MLKWILNKSLFGGIKNADYETIRLALEKGADPNSYHFGCTPLMRACMTGNDRVIGMIVEAGGDPSKRDVHGRFDTYQYCRDNGFEPKIEIIETELALRQAKKNFGVE